MIDQVINIADWRGEEESRIFPVGTREKKLVFCPDPAPLSFLEKGRGYLFKLAVKKCPEQFWIEIFAYRLSLKMLILVPPTFVAYDREAQRYGALIRWFLDETPVGNTRKMEKFESGSDLLQGYIDDFDSKKGLKHNFETVAKIFKDKYNHVDWQQHWARTFLFDALIGNIDRHQDNWGIIAGFNGTRISPVFDNGTSMGYEIKSDRFHLYDDDRLRFYVQRGKHHMKWQLNDPRIQHHAFLKRYIQQYPETRFTMLDCLNRVGAEDFKTILQDLINFNVPIRLSNERAHFMLRLLQFRHNMLLKELGG